jgi:lipoyl(octanoyl) transferase
LTSGGSRIAEFRVLPVERLGATRQLALTEAIIDEVGRNLAPPTLRLYAWLGESMILGAGQPSAEIDLAACQAHETALLRRISGGTAVLHDESTISFQLTLPAAHPFISDDIHVSYRRMAELIVAVLAKLGIESTSTPLEESRGDRPPEGLAPLCFSSLAPYEITARRRKLIGLAQVKRGNATALQGMVYRAFDPAKMVRLLPRGTRSAAELENDLAARTTDLMTESGREISLREFETAFLSQAVAVIGQATEPAEMSAAEAERADVLERTKYGTPEWTFRR